jgi:TRAP-type C4-dicarboxylate transport system permease large subunit
MSGRRQRFRQVSRQLAIGRVAPDTAMRAIWPYVGALIAALVIVALFPWISTCLL